MPEPDSGDPQRWLRFALEDLEASERGLSLSYVLPRHACFLAQQAGEKALKAAILAEGIEPPRHHALDALRNLLPVEWAVHERFPNLAELSLWASAARYPSHDRVATPEQAVGATALARELIECLLPDLRARGVRYENIDTS